MPCSHTWSSFVTRPFTARGICLRHHCHQFPACPARAGPPRGRAQARAQRISARRSPFACASNPYLLPSPAPCWSALGKTTPFADTSPDVRPCRSSCSYSFCHGVGRTRLSQGVYTHEYLVLGLVLGMHDQHRLSMPGQHRSWQTLLKQSAQRSRSTSIVPHLWHRPQRHCAGCLISWVTEPSSSPYSSL